MEGSVLGGRIISKALEAAAWTPPGGLRYFDPHGPKSGILRRRFQAALGAAASDAGDPFVELGALQTFELLHRWLIDGASSS
jgi:heme oxygenase